MSPNSSDGPTPGPFQPGTRDVGVEVNPLRIRAGVFAPGYRLLGKVKLTTKVERGPQAIIQRIARCVLDAADECDLNATHIRRVVVGLPGEVDDRSGVALQAPELGWIEAVPLRAELEQRLSLPVQVANLYNLSALAIQHLELNRTAQVLAVIFIGYPFHFAVLRSGSWVSQPELRASLKLSTDPLMVAPREYQKFRPRDFRKALRQGDQAVHKHLLQLSTHAAAHAARIEEAYRPEAIIFSGNAVEEIEKDVLAHIQEQLRFVPDRTPTSRLLVSALGDSAGIMGAAVLAAQQLAPIPADALVS